MTTIYRTAKMLPACLLMTILMFLASTSFALEMSIIPLTNTRPESILPVIEKQLGEDSSASAYQGQIILNATREETEKIKTLVSMLDVAGRQLQIFVSTGNTGSADNTTFSVSNHRNDGIRITRNGRINNTTTTIQQRSSTIAGSGQQGIRATEGQPAYISTGSSRPYTQYSQDANGIITQTQAWQDADTGFWATAWINESNVTIEIEQRKEGFKDDTLDSQQLHTTINGKLGEWISVGSSNSSDSNDTRSLDSLGRNSTTESDNIYLKVELLE